VPQHIGHEVPRLWTRPLRPLTPETSLGFEVIDFARTILGVTLWPWQCWLLIHALELLENGEYRFRRVIVLVGRQNGKTTLASVLAAWWLFVDSRRHPDKVPPLKFKIVGVAQNLDIAKEPWAPVKLWCDPDPENEEDAELAIPSLRTATAKVIDTNGALAIQARSRAHYEIRAAKNARGKPAARVLMDEMREQRDDVAWNAVSQTTKSFWNGMLFGFSNAGDARSIVLLRQRTAALLDLLDAGYDVPDYIDRGMIELEAYANGEDPDDAAADTSLGLFEWSAAPGVAKNDLDAILQSNPSIGHGSMTVEICLADIRGMTDAGYRTEVLCQWVTANVDSYMDPKDWAARQRPADKVKIPRGARTVWSIDTSVGTRRVTWISSAVYTQAGHPFVTVRERRAGMLWVADYMADLAEKSGNREVVLQAKGCPAMDFVEPLREKGLIVHALEGGLVASATGRLRDRVLDGDLVTIEQPDLDLAVEGGVVQKFGDNDAWSRQKSLPVDIAGLVAETLALYGLEVLTPPEKKSTPPPPPPAATLPRDDVLSSDTNLATVAF